MAVARHRRRKARVARAPIPATTVKSHTGIKRQKGRLPDRSKL